MSFTIRKSAFVLECRDQKPGPPGTNEETSMLEGCVPWPADVAARLESIRAAVDPTGMFPLSV